MKPIQIASEEHHKQLAMERRNRMRPAIQALAEEAATWVGAYGPGGPTDEIRKIKSVTKYGSYTVTVVFNYRRQGRQ